MEQQSLFGNRAGQDMPLATRMRPRTLEEFAGQRHLLGKGKVLRQLIEEDRVSSMIFWGRRAWVKRRWRRSLRRGRRRISSISVP